MAPGAMLHTGGMSFPFSTKRDIASSGCKIRLPRCPMTSTERRKLLAAQDAPTLLVGHAYGCAVITGVGLASNVVGLVYLAGPALDEGESLKSLWRCAHRLRERPTFGRTGMDFYGSRLRSFARPSVTILTRRSRWCGPLRRSRQPRVALKTSPDPQRGKRSPVGIRFRPTIG